MFKLYYFRFANFYQLVTPDNIVFQYRVDFKCPDDLSHQTGKKFYLMNQHKKDLPLFLFDGTVMFTIQKVSTVSFANNA
jgi:hypothetical protein